MKKMNKKGFTLVEIMIVVAIIGLLAAIGIPSFQKARTSSQTKACINNCRIIEAAMDQAAMENANDPATYATYIKGGVLPVCPSGTSAYSVGTTAGSAVVCPNSTSGHPSS